MAGTDPVHIRSIKRHELPALLDLYQHLHVSKEDTVTEETLGASSSGHMVCNAWRRQCSHAVGPFAMTAWMATGARTPPVLRVPTTRWRGCGMPTAGAVGP